MVETVFFFFTPKLQCAPFVSEGGRYIDQEGMHAKPGSSEEPLLAAAPLEGTASVWLGTERSLLGDTLAADNGGRFIGIRSEGVKYWPHF